MLLHFEQCLFYLLLAHTGRNSTDTDAFIATRIATVLPFEYPVAVAEAGVDVQAFLFPMFTMFLLPSFVFTIVSEKEKRLFKVWRWGEMYGCAFLS